MRQGEQEAVLVVGPANGGLGVAVVLVACQLLVMCQAHTMSQLLRGLNGEPGVAVLGIMYWKFYRFSDSSAQAV